jgi:hypothetical protein
VQIPSKAQYYSILDLRIFSFAFLCILTVSLCLPLKTSLTPYNSELANLWSVWNNIWSWSPWALPLAGPLCMLLLIFLFGPSIINALSRFISQQVQLIKFQLLVKEYSSLPMHEPSVKIYWRLLETTWVNPWDKYHHTYPLSPYCQHESATRVISPLPNSIWVLVSEGGLVGSGSLKDRWVSQYPIPHGEHYEPCTLRRSYMVS